MAKLQLGCQTITWRSERTKKRDYTVEAVADAGYAGIEIGARFLDLDKGEEFKAVLDRNKIKMCSLHTGWCPDKPSAPEMGRDKMDRIIAFARITETTNIVMSGTKEIARLTAGLPDLNVIGEKCKQRGITFCYHNHYWEIENHAKVLVDIEKQTDPAFVSFCPDIGWVRKTTPEVLETLEIIKHRIRIAHLKDYLTDDLSVRDDETEFGKGIMDFNEAFGFLRGLDLDDLWVIAEQSRSTEGLAPEESIRANYQFMKDFIV